jgi:hypothetical protein
MTMARDWESQFQTWARPPSTTETEKMQRAEKAIRDAIAADAKLQEHDIVVFPQGSYRNRTNVAGESDVDICVVARDVFFSDWDWVDTRARTDDAVRFALQREADISDATYTYAEYKNDVGAALVRKFGPPPAVERGDKAYDIHENTYRVESDCLAALEARHWSRASGVLSDAVRGTEFVSDSGRRIQNFPQQQYDNGVAKHTRTGDHFKKMVRVLKNLRNEMDANGRPEADPIPSFLSECLVYRVPDDRFGATSRYDELREVLRYLYNETKSDETCGKWLEENDIKFLFHSSQPWTRVQVNAFVLAAWQYVGYGNS